MFKQKVTTDDVFLGMSGKNSSTACCEDLLVCMIFLISKLFHPIISSEVLSQKCRSSESQQH